LLFVAFDLLRRTVPGSRRTTIFTCAAIGCAAYGVANYLKG